MAKRTASENRAAGADTRERRSASKKPQKLAVDGAPSATGPIEQAARLVPVPTVVLSEEHRVQLRELFQWHRESAEASVRDRRARRSAAYVLDLEPNFPERLVLAWNAKHGLGELVGMAAALRDWHRVSASAQRQARKRIRDQRQALQVARDVVLELWIDRDFEHIVSRKPSQPFYAMHRSAAQILEECDRLLGIRLKFLKPRPLVGRRTDAWVEALKAAIAAYLVREGCAPTESPDGFYQDVVKLLIKAQTGKTPSTLRVRPAVREARAVFNALRTKSR